VVRTGNVAVANALGTGVLETPGFTAFLPALCRRLLGEELLLPSVATWWCGKESVCDHVVANLHDLVVKPAHAGSRFEPVFGGELTAQGLEELRGRIIHRPCDYIAQERLTLSTAPALVGDRLEPRRIVVRMYLAADNDSFVMMPGGLTRFSASPETMVVSMQSGGGSKDSWVLSESPVAPVSLLPPGGTSVRLSRGGSDLPSRVADNLFWLGRYAERAEGLTRLLRGVLVRLTEASGLAESTELPVLLRAMTMMSASQPGFVGEGAEARLAAPQAELLSVVYDPHRAGSVASVLAALSRLAGTVRDRISRDMWRVVSDLADLRHRGATFELETGTRAAPVHKGNGRVPTLSEALDQLDRAVLTLAAFSGLSTDSVTRGDGWRFLDLGRKLERSLHTVSLLRNTLVFVVSPEGPLLESLLEIADSSMTYRRRYQGSLHAAAVLDLLLADESNPRSLAFQLAAVADHVEHLPRDDSGAARSAEQRLMLSALTAVRLADADQLAQVDAGNCRLGLEHLLNEVAGSLPGVSDAITQTYLIHLQAARHLGGGVKS
jgi:uncharacterized alpha-E superfamily protein